MKNGIDYLNSLGLHKVKPGLGRIHKLLKALDNPQDKVPGIIIAGTNGKGSVASTIASILSAQGYDTGLYTSPHLISITERIKINDIQIVESDLSSILLELKELCNKLNISPSYFEIITAVAYLYFARKNVDINVLEVGMGGRWDATNVITPIASVITNISKDHSEYLGEQIAKIAAEKACIIKPSVPVITGATGQALKVVEDEASKNSSPILVHKREFSIEEQDKEHFSYTGPSWEIEDLSSNLKGKYQSENLSIAIATLEVIDEKENIHVQETSIRKGLQKINWPGRFEIIREKPPIILDGAHNPGASKAIVESIKEIYPNTMFTFLIGMLNDKGHLEFIEEVSSIAEKLIITKVPSERTADTDELLALAQKHIENIEIIENYKTAYTTILNSNEPSCITGSLYLVGAIKNLIQNT